MLVFEDTRRAEYLFWDTVKMPGAYTQSAHKSKRNRLLNSVGHILLQIANIHVLVDPYPSLKKNEVEINALEVAYHGHRYRL